MSNRGDEIRTELNFLIGFKEIMESKVERSKAFLISGEHDERIACSGANYVGKDGMCYPNPLELEKADDKYNEEKPVSLFKML